MRRTITVMIIKAIIHPMRASTKPSPPPKIVFRIPPAQVTRSEYSNPVVSEKSVDDDAIRAFTGTMRFLFIISTLGLTFCVIPPES